MAKYIVAYQMKANLSPKTERDKCKPSENILGASAEDILLT